MNEAKIERGLILFFRLAMAWTFLYAGLRQVFFSDFSVIPFLTHTKTFHEAYAVFATAQWAPIISFAVKWGHLLIGLSLLAGLLVRVSSVFGILLLGMYWTAHMDFPYIETKVNFLLDYHIVYMAILGLLVLKQAGHVFGLDGWLEKQKFIVEHPELRPLVG
ncbi:MAG TPA: DoxX family protein [Terriglobales bacterium]|nr:DoxX family protein [Terriglobales bacterium]